MAKKMLVKSKKEYGHHRLAEGEDSSLKGTSLKARGHGTCGSDPSGGVEADLSNEKLAPDAADFFSTRRNMHGVELGRRCAKNMQRSCHT